MPKRPKKQLRLLKPPPSKLKKTQNRPKVKPKTSKKTQKRPKVKLKDSKNKPKWLYRTLSKLRWMQGLPRPPLEKQKAW